MSRWRRWIVRLSRLWWAICASWNQHHRVPILFVTHNGEEVFALGDEVIVLDAGRIVAQGQPHEVMYAPRLETVAHLSGFENIFDATVRHCTKIAGP